MVWLDYSPIKHADASIQMSMTEPSMRLAAEDVQIPDNLTGGHCAICGLQWGDEAKGKIVDWLTQDHDVIIRYNGGSNAGHTVVKEQKTYKFSLVPTGILWPNRVAVLGCGVVIHPKALIQ